MDHLEGEDLLGAVGGAGDVDGADLLIVWEGHGDILAGVDEGGVGGGVDAGERIQVRVWDGLGRHDVDRGLLLALAAKPVFRAQLAPVLWAVPAPRRVPVARPTPMVIQYNEREQRRERRQQRPPGSTETAPFFN